MLPPGKPFPKQFPSLESGAGGFLSNILSPQGIGVQGFDKLTILNRPSTARMVLMVVDEARWGERISPGCYIRTEPGDYALAQAQHHKS